MTNKNRVTRAWVLFLMGGLLVADCACPILDDDDDITTVSGRISVSPTTLEFGWVPLGETQDLPIQVLNQGDGPLAVSAIFVDADAGSPDFALPAQPLAFTLPRAESHNVNVRFTPLGPGEDTGTLVLRSNDPDLPEVRVTLFGPALPRIMASPSPLDFSAGHLTNPLMLTLQGTVSLGNFGRAPLTIRSVGVRSTDANNDFSLAEVFNGLTVEPGGSTAIVVVYSRSERATSGYLVVQSDDPGHGTLEVELKPSPVGACGNGSDDDSDGLADYPDDPGCQDVVDDDESNSTVCAQGGERHCGSDVGQCRSGLQTCTDGVHWSPCQGATGPTNEWCDGQDNDCDDVVDEDTAVCGTSSSGPSSSGASSSAPSSYGASSGSPSGGSIEIGPSSAAASQISSSNTSGSSASGPPDGGAPRDGGPAVQDGGFADGGDGGPACTDPCLPSATRCSGNGNEETCALTGCGWTETSTCLIGCAGGACVVAACNSLTSPSNGTVSAPTTTYGSIATYSCNTGYTMNGSSTRTCEAGGSWSGSAPSCVPVECGSLTNPSDGTVSAPTTTLGGTATYSCNTGYSISGSSTRTCDTGGAWSGSAPSCVPVDCGSLTNPSNGTVSAPTTTLGGTATYSCNTGYSISGSSTRTCDTGGAWSGTAPSCVPVDCGSLTNPSNGMVSAPMTTLGGTATYSCSPGYNISGSSTRTCDTGGTWSGTAPSCVPVDCGSLTSPTNGTVSVPTTTFAATATYACNTGYNISGSSTRTCGTGGVWSGSAPSCVPVDCGSLTSPTNGTVSAPTTTYGSTATYSCNAGYPISGSSTRTCGTGGFWSGTAPSCVQVDCGSLANPTNGTVTAPTTTFGGTATYSCNAGYNISGASTRTCGTGGAWSGSAPSCVPVDCGSLTSPSNGTVSAPTTTLGGTATYSCNTGYNISGSSTRTCGTGGFWSGSALSCVPVDCGSLTNPSNGTVSAPTTTFGATATYACNTGYNISGSSTRTCGAGGTWSGSAPTCPPINCGSLSNPTNGSVSAPTTTYGSTATYSCNTYYVMSGASSRTCQLSGSWSGSAPTCSPCPTTYSYSTAPSCGTTYCQEIISVTSSATTVRITRQDGTAFGAWQFIPEFYKAPSTHLTSNSSCAARTGSTSYTYTSNTSNLGLTVGGTGGFFSRVWTGPAGNNCSTSSYDTGTRSISMVCQ
ncbi:MAG: choice-of-anchor D domain-containing protein [Deltaproteobacteria bacterium]|nr:choice-of-anchor D domain-containing protein [Deltaproteobacteria bacterium]